MGVDSHICRLSAETESCKARATRPDEHAVAVSRRARTRGDGSLQSPARQIAPKNSCHLPPKVTGSVVSYRWSARLSGEGRANRPAAGAGELIGYARCSIVLRPTPGKPRLPGQNRRAQPAGEHADVGAAAGRAHRRGARPGRRRRRAGRSRRHGDVMAEQHAADHLPGVPGRVLEAVGHVSPLS